MVKGRVVSFCDRSGVMVQDWLDAGFECWLIDLQHKPGIHRDGLLYRVGGDAATVDLPFEWASIVFAFPPCTDLAVSGARWFQDKGIQSFIDALQLVENLRIRCDELSRFWMLENPVGRLVSTWRPWDFSFNPNEFAGYLDDPSIEAYTKKTCIWSSPEFRIPVRRPVPAVLGSKMHLLAPSADRQNLRSLTPSGFARAVFLANSLYVPNASLAEVCSFVS